MADKLRFVKGQVVLVVAGPHNIGRLLSRKLQYGSEGPHHWLPYLQSVVGRTFKVVDDFHAEEGVVWTDAEHCIPTSWIALTDNNWLEPF